MAMRNDRDIERREDRSGWHNVGGDYGRIQSREDMRDFRARNERLGNDDDRRGDHARYQARDARGRFEDDVDRDDDNRGWFDRVRDTASRWLRGRDDDDDRRNFDDDRRGEHARFQPRD